MQNKKLFKDIERDLLINIVLGIKHSRIKVSSAKEISKKFLESYPYSTIEEVFERLNLISKEYEEARNVYIKYALSYEEEKRLKKLKIGRMFMEKKDFENAIKTMKGEIYGRI